MSRYIDDTPSTGGVLVSEVEHVVRNNLDRQYSAKGLHLRALVEELGKQRDAVEFHRQCAADANAQANAMRVRMSTAEELATNIRRNIKHIVRDINAGDQHVSVLLDYLNHTDTMAQKIETELDTTCPPATLPLEIAGSPLPDDYVSPRLAAEAYRENEQ